MNIERRLLLVGHSPSETSGAVPLPGVATECRRIAAAWPKPVTTSLDQAASESFVTRQLPIHQIVHLATHGFVDEQADNLFGGLLLAPEADGDDSLSYLDILRTDLTGCELAVLSACQTSVAPNARWRRARHWLKPSWRPVLGKSSRVSGMSRTKAPPN